LRAGVNWLLQLQNSDGGWPTFCRGWGSLPFDQSSPDVTAHAIRALRVTDPAQRQPAWQRAIAAGFAFLHRVQRDDGAWLPLWFGNQAAPAGHNPVLGTARVLQAYAEVAPSAPEARRAVDYLLRTQHAQGGWGGEARVPPSVEESALAIIALRHWRELPNVESAWLRGLDYLISRVEDGSWSTPSPIGLYFASLWYSEELYPIIWTVEALVYAGLSG
jgi:squalene-hopene/tetraprenyl-beta-curcumene cyclase